MEINIEDNFRILFEKNNKKKELYHAVDAIRTRFGNHMITKAKLLKNRD